MRKPELRALAGLPPLAEVRAKRQAAKEAANAAKAARALEVEAKKAARPAQWRRLNGRAKEALAERGSPWLTEAERRERRKKEARD